MSSLDEVSAGEVQTPKSSSKVKKEKSTSSTKVKKEKSSKKRKAETLAEATEPVPPLAPTPTTKSDRDSSPDVASPADDTIENPPKKRKVLENEIEVDITLPEPPSKKELRRLKKGKTLPPSKSGAATSTEDTESADAPKKEKAEVEKRSEHGVWIGNMPFHVSKDDLRKFLVEQSDLNEEDITRVHMPGPNDKKSANKVEVKKYRPDQNKGFAYVDFSTAEGVTHAVELSEQLLGGRRVLIKDNKSFEGRPAKTKEETRKEGKPPSKRVFLGNLSFDTSEDSLTQHFEKCGAVESVKVATFEDTGKCKGYAWIVFEELKAAESAVAGYVYILDEDSDVDESDNSDADEDAELAKSKLKAKKPKMRKWWTNKIKGRPLRMEFAEDAQVRYKKRYGKDGTKAAAAGKDGGEREERPRDGPIVPKAVEYRKEYAPRLTGGIVESKGKKVTF